MEYTVRELRPGETIFGGGRGFLIPFRPGRTTSSRKPSADTPASDSAPKEAQDPMLGAEEIVAKGLAQLIQESTVPKEVYDQIMAERESREE